MPASSRFPIPRGVRSLLALLAASLLSLPAFAQTQPPIYPVITLYPPNVSSATFTVGDFNGDGQSDLAYVSPPFNGTSSTITIVLSALTVTTPVSVQTSPLPCSTVYSLVAADINNDSKLDLVLNCAGKYVTVLLGNGDGSFQTPDYYFVPGLPAIARPQLVDLDGDGYLDVAVGTSVNTGPSNGIAVLLNQGNSARGTLSTPQIYPASFAPSSLSSGDFNGDGKQDILAGSGQLAVFYGNGNGTLQTPQVLPLPQGSAAAFVTTDLNNDGIADIAYLINGSSNVDPSSLQILLGSSTGTFTNGSNLPLNLATSLVLFPSTSQSNNTNLAVVGNNTTILIADGKGSFTPGQTLALTGNVVPQVGSDGKINLLANVGDGFVLLPGNGNGTFQGLPSSSIGLNAFAAADVNNDGLTDILSLDAHNNLTAALGRGDGTFSNSSQIAGLTGNFLITGDFNGDGKIDAAGITVGNGVGHGETVAQDAMLFLYKGNGDGTFHPNSTGADLQVIGAVNAVVGDFNGDGSLDVVASFNNEFSAPSIGLVFLPGKGDGTFGAAIPFSQQNSTNGWPLFTADLNNDKKLDLIWNSAVYLGNGDGTFQQIPFNLTGTPLALADLNGDGFPDLVIGANVYAGNGNGTFQTTPFYTISLPPAAISIVSAVIGDVNADGHPDILTQYVSATDIGGVAVSYGNGTGSFITDNNAYYTGSLNLGTPSNTVLARLNNQAPTLPHDNTLDYLVTNNGTTTSLLNQTNPTPTAPSLLPSTTTFTFSINNTALIQQLTLTATVNGIAPTGSVTFQSGSTTFGKVPLTNGVATLVISSPSPGTYSVTAAYTGDTNNLPSASAAIPVTITLPPTTTTLTSSSPLTGSGNQDYTFTATVTGNNPTGSVTFASGSTTLLTAPLNHGTIVFVLAGLNFNGLGTYPITATYLGDSNNAPSTSNSINIVISTSDFVLSSSTPLLQLTITAGQSATTTLTPTSIDGYNGTVKFSCANLPAETTCTFSPPSVTLASGGAPQSTKLTITTTAPTTALLRRFARSASGVAWAGLLCLTFLPRRIRRMHQRLTITSVFTLLLAAVLIPLFGCSSSPSQSPAPNSGTPVGTQQIAIVAADASGGPSHTIPVQLIIQ